MFFLDTAGILRNIPKNENPSRLNVPKNLVDEVLHSCHNIPAMGHQGVVRTYLRVKEKFYWFSMSQATKNFVRTCDVCSKFKNANRKVRCPMSKMERVHLDFLGPLPESTSGNTNILVMVDQFTKCPYQAKQPKWRQEQRWMNFVCTFWFPVMWSAPNSQKSHTPYRSSANGQVVRFNRTITDAVRYFVGKLAIGMNTCRSLLVLSIHLSTEIQVSHQTSSCLDVKLLYQQI